MERMKIRRVVTGHDSEGKARVVDDRDVEPITSELMPGCASFRLWGRDERPTFPDDGSPRRAKAWFPPRDGSRFMINMIPPGELAHLRISIWLRLWTSWSGRCRARWP